MLEEFVGRYSKIQGTHRRRHSALWTNCGSCHQSDALSTRICVKIRPISLNTRQGKLCRRVGRVSRKNRTPNVNRHGNFSIEPQPQNRFKFYKSFRLQYMIDVRKILLPYYNLLPIGPTPKAELPMFPCFTPFSPFSVAICIASCCRFYQTSILRNMTLLEKVFALAAVLMC